MQYKKGDRVLVECEVASLDSDGDIYVRLPDSDFGGRFSGFGEGKILAHRDYVTPKPDMSFGALYDLWYAWDINFVEGVDQGDVDALSGGQKKDLILYLLKELADDEAL